MTRPHDLDALIDLSARIGADPLLIQAAGGNTSVKEGETLWIKASGTRLAEARERDIFVACDLPAMRASVAAGEARADRPAEFVRTPGALRPSIETSLHAVFPQRVVLHVHCVQTLAVAVRADATEVLAARLTGFHWAFVPYSKPGANLARAVAAALSPATDVIVLGNHGLIVAAESVAEAETLLRRACAALSRPGRLPDPVLTRLSGLLPLAGAGYRPLPAGDPMHAVAADGWACKAAMGGTLYPDHVIFCGPGVEALRPGEGAAEAVGRLSARGEAPPPFLLVPGLGALVREGASSGALALIRCLADVLARVPEEVELRYLAPAQVAELRDWDAEKYRQALNVT